MEQEVKVMMGEWLFMVCVFVVVQSCLTLCNPMEVTYGGTDQINVLRILATKFPTVKKGS